MPNSIASTPPGGGGGPPPPFLRGGGGLTPPPNYGAVSALPGWMEAINSGTNDCVPQIRAVGDFLVNHAIALGLHTTTLISWSRVHSERPGFQS